MAYSRLLKLMSPMMYGTDIKEVQSRLRKLYYSPGTIDGWFGSKTDAAVRKFQQRNDLVIDGIVGPNTWAKLFSSSAVTEAVFLPADKYYYMRKIAYTLPINYPSVITAENKYSVDVGILRITYQFSYRRDFSVSFSKKTSITVVNGRPTTYNISKNNIVACLPLFGDAKKTFDDLCIGITNGTIFVGINGDGSLAVAISQNTSDGYIYHEITIKSNDNLNTAKETVGIIIIVLLLILLILELGIPAVVGSAGLLGTTAGPKVAQLMGL